VTGITIFPSDTEGRPLGDDMCRTRKQPPIPVLGVRPGADPSQSSLFLNGLATGDVAITLARGLQNFLLYTAMVARADHFVIAIHLDHEASPSLSAVVDGDLSHPVRGSQAAAIMALDGEPMRNTSSASVSRKGYRVFLQRAAFPLGRPQADTVSLWSLQPDEKADMVGVMSLQVEPLP
jgi:hypothetical protein